MKDILQRLLGKRGIKDVEELDSEEKKTFETWEKVLSKEELTTKDIKEFCRNQCEIIESKWKDYGLSQDKKAELIPYHTIYKTLLTIIDSPKAAREQLEQHLQQQLEQ